MAAVAPAPIQGPQAIKAWVRMLAVGDLPGNTQSIEHIAHLREQLDTIRPQVVARAILMDPLLTLRLLRTANSSGRNRLTSETTTVSQALILMGLGRCTDLCTSAPHDENLVEGRPEVIRRLRDLLHRARRAMALSRDFAQFRQDRDAEEVGIAAGLIELPEILLCLRAPEAAMQMIKARRIMPSHLAERAVLGTTIAELRTPLLEAMNIPEALCGLMMPDMDKPRVLGAHIAVGLIREFEHGGDPEVIDDDVLRAAELLRLDPEQLSVIVVRSLGSTAREEAAEAAEVAALHESYCVLPEIRQDRVQEAVAEISAHLDGTLNLHQMLMLALRGLTEGAGLKRALFALLSPDRTHIKARAWVGVDPASDLAHLDLPANDSNAFGKLLADKMSAIHHDPETRAAEGVLTSPELRAYTCDHPFFAMSLFVQGKPVGVLYADQNGQAPLDARQFDVFKLICLRAAQGLGHLAS